jgi:hypothetical protein
LDHNTSDWIGPFSVVLAQNSTVANDTSNSLVDQFVSRYVNTISTPFLQMSPNCTLFGQLDFDRLAGRKAVNTTIHKQTQLGGGGKDPYASYQEDCHNGNVEPILPHFKFGFTNSTPEKLQIQLDYKIMTVPNKKDPVYKLMPSLQKRFNHKNSAFHISGPYCYGDDPNRGYTFDISFNSARPSQDISLTKGCIQGLPCLPPAAAIGDTQHIIVYNQTQAGIVDVVDVTKAFLIFGCYSFLIALIVSLTCNYQLSGKLKRLQREPAAPRTLPAQSTVNNSNSSPFGDLEGEEDGGDEDKDDDEDVNNEVTGDSLAQPLLKHKEDGCKKRDPSSGVSQHEVV